VVPIPTLPALVTVIGVLVLPTVELIPLPVKTATVPAVPLPVTVCAAALIAKATIIIANPALCLFVIFLPFPGYYAPSQFCC
jgi:hypothetical protein